MFLRNYRKTMIVLIAVGCCAVIFRWNPFSKNDRDHESLRSSISNDSSFYQSKGASNISSSEDLLLLPPDDDELMEPPAHIAEGGGAEISNLPQSDDPVSKETARPPLEGFESAPIEQPSNTQSGSLQVNEESFSSIQPIPEETLGTLLSEVATPLNKGKSLKSGFNRNPFTEKNEPSVEEMPNHSVQPNPDKGGKEESGFRAETSNTNDPIESNHEWSANPFSQVRTRLDPSPKDFIDPITDKDNGQAIPKATDEVQTPPKPAENDFLPNPTGVSGAGHSSDINLPTASVTFFEANDESRPGSESTHYLAGILPGTAPGSPNNSNKTTPPPEENTVGTQRPHVLHGAENFVLAAEPKKGDHWKSETPIVDQRAVVIEPIPSDFSPTPTVDDCLPYDPYQQQDIYQNKQLNANQRPIIEWGRPWYQLGQLSPGSTILGKHNPVEPQFLVFGDVRSAIASNAQNGNSSTLMAVQANLNFDLKITSTERFHMFMSPLSKGLESTGVLFDEDRFVNNTNANILAGYFEGDLGAMVGGATNKTLPFDLPFAVGVMPLLFQNGVWMEDQILGFAVTIPARNSPRFDISNMEFTFFAGYDKVVSDALPGDDGAGKIFGIASFLEAFNGYVEADYAFVEDRTFLDRSYHNLGIGYTRRFGRFISNSTRAIVNLGQQPDGIAQTADGWLLLSENSLITGAPSTVVPYFNLFAGFDRPQSVARAVQADGVLRNTGILFETDNLTGYPTLDATANETFGGALGLNLLASDFSQQLIVETAFLNTMGNDADRNAPGNQYGLGMRYQLPLTNALIFRTDAMYGFLDNAEDIHGFRVELRHKY